MTAKRRGGGGTFFVRRPFSLFNWSCSWVEKRRLQNEFDNYLNIINRKSLTIYLLCGFRCNRVYAHCSWSKILDFHYNRCSCCVRKLQQCSSEGPKRSQHMVQVIFNNYCHIVMRFELVSHFEWINSKKQKKISNHFHEQTRRMCSIYVQAL